MGYIERATSVMRIKECLNKSKLRKWLSLFKNNLNKMRNFPVIQAQQGGKVGIWSLQYRVITTRVPGERSVAPRSNSSTPPQLSVSV